MPKVSLRTPVRPPVRLPVTVVPVEENREPHVRISNPEGARFTSRRRAEKFVARGWAVWSGNAIRFTGDKDRKTPVKARAEFRATRIDASLEAAQKIIANDSFLGEISCNENVEVENSRCNVPCFRF